jgi:hypothetical protein
MKQKENGVEIQKIKRQEESEVCVSLRVRFPAGAGNFSLHHRIQTGSGAHPTPYTIDTGGSFPVGNEAGS